MLAAHHHMSIFFIFRHTYGTCFLFFTHTIAMEQSQQIHVDFVLRHFSLSIFEENYFKYIQKHEIEKVL
jgi:hypothetical protein